MKIRNAKDTPLSSNPGTLPNVSGALFGYFRKMIAVKLTKSTDNFDAKEVVADTEAEFMGVKQPFTYRQLLMKPEGQRGWKWFMIHSTPDFVLELDDEFTIDGLEYRVMRQGQYNEYGYVSYEVVEDYQA